MTNTSNDDEIYYDREHWLKGYGKGNSDYDTDINPITENGTPLWMIGKWQRYGTAPIKNPSDLKWLMEKDPDSKHFSRENMKFFGDTMSNFGLRKPKEIKDIMGDIRFAYELYRKRPVKNGLDSSHWFEIHNDGTVVRVFPKD
jgi:hypothetical protein